MATIQDRINAETAKALKGAPAAALAEVARLQAENEALKLAAAKRQTISYKVSEKMAGSVYGLGRFPVTLYKGQWRKLIEEITSGRLPAWLDAHDAELSDKPTA